MRMSESHWNTHYKDIGVLSLQRVSFPTYSKARNIKDNEPIICFYKTFPNLCYKHIMFKSKGKIVVLFKDVEDADYDVIYEEEFNEENYINACDFCIEDIKA